ncbi:7453_t:CDS:1, partial [Cetraspora pellucida]
PLQRPQNIGGLQNANDQIQRALNIGRQIVRFQNTANLFNNNFIAVQNYTNLVSSAGSVH